MKNGTVQLIQKPTLKTPLSTRHTENGLKRGTFPGTGRLMASALGALQVNVHGITWPLVLINEIVALETAPHVLAECLNNSHVLEPSIVLLLALTRGVTDIRLR
jgi:hypothetical protein